LNNYDICCPAHYLRSIMSSHILVFVAERCNLHRKVRLLSWYVVCRLSGGANVGYCDETTVARITWFSLESSEMS